MPEEPTPTTPEQSAIGKVMGNRGAQAGIFGVLVTALVKLQTDLSDMRAAMDRVPAYELAMDQTALDIAALKASAIKVDTHQSDKSLHMTANARLLAELQSLQPVEEAIARIKQSLADVEERQKELEADIEKLEK